MNKSSRHILVDLAKVLDMVDVKDCLLLCNDINIKKLITIKSLFSLLETHRHSPSRFRWAHKGRLIDHSQYLNAVTDRRGSSFLLADAVKMADLWKSGAALPG